MTKIILLKKILIIFAFCYNIYAKNKLKHYKNAKFTVEICQESYNVKNIINNQILNIIKHDLTYEFDENFEYYYGKTITTFTILKTTNQNLIAFYFNQKNLTHYSLNNNNLNIKIQNICKLTLNLPIILILFQLKLNFTYNLTIDYIQKLNEKNIGIFKSSYLQILNNTKNKIYNHKMIFTNTYPFYADSLFPCLIKNINQPLLSLKIIYPSKYYVYSSFSIISLTKLVLII